MAKHSKWYVGAGAVALGSVLAFAVPAGAAVNLQSESSGGSAIQIVKEAQLKAKGAATVVTSKVTCPAGWTYYLDVSVVQTVNPHSTTNGQGDLPNQRCTGTTVRAKVNVPVSGGGAPFKTGVAYATANLQVSSPWGYVTLSTGREIVNVQS